MTKRVNWLSWHSEVIRVKCSQPLHKLIFCHSKNWPPNLICDFKWDVQSVSRDPLSRKWVTKVILIKGEFQFVWSSQPLHKLIFCHSKNWPPNLICDFKWDVQSVSRDPLSRKWVTKVILIKGEFQFVCGCWDSKSSYELFESGVPSLFDDFKNSVDRVKKKKKKRRRKEKREKNQRPCFFLFLFRFLFLFLILSAIFLKKHKSYEWCKYNCYKYGGITPLNTVLSQLCLDLIFKRFSLKDLFCIEVNGIPGK